MIPPRAIEALAEHYGRGAQKYADRNWEKGVDWSLSFAAMQRHLWAFWNGDEADEDGNSHLAAAMWHVAALIEYGHTHPELDDRPRGKRTNSLPIDFDWESVRRVTAEDCPPSSAFLIDTGRFIFQPDDPLNDWLSEEGLDTLRALAAEDKFDEDFLAYLDWRDTR